MYTGLTDDMKKSLEKGREYHVFRPFYLTNTLQSGILLQDCGYIARKLSANHIS